MLLWDLDGMAGVRPIELRRSGGWHFSMTDFHPAGDWVVASTHDNSELSFWPLGENLPTVVEGYDTFSLVPVGFTQDGRYLVTNWGQDRVRLWPLPGGRDPDIVDVLLPRAYPVRAGFAVDPTGRRILSAGYGETIFLLSSQGEDPLHLTGFSQYDLVEQGAFSPSGHLVAAASAASESQPTLRVWDVETGAVLVFDLPQRTEGSSADGVASGAMVQNLVFADETTLYTSGGNGLLRWDLETGSYEQITRTTPGAILLMSASTDRRKILTYEAADRNSRGQLELRDLVTGHVRRVQIPGGSAVVSLGPKGTTWATGEKDGLIWVGRFDGGEPHVLAGHQGPIASIAISPDRKWIASTGEDKTLRLWPMPDLDRPPLHTLPRQELIAKLKVLTNLRVVRDEESSDGWTTKLDPFPGWETVPEW
jgi:WD40 repeat protein